MRFGPNNDKTFRLYCGYTNEPTLTRTGVVFKVAGHVGLIGKTETGYGWSEDRISLLESQVRKAARDNPQSLAGLPSDICAEVLELLLK